jgi:RNA polymerase sigma-B factor
MTLFRSWREDGDPRARERLVEHYLPMARQLARRYLGANEPYDDLVQVASLGLVKAIDRFDPERGRLFSSFAVPTILGELKRYFRDTGWSVHVSRSVQERALRVERGAAELLAQNGRAPSPAELAQALELSLGETLEGLEVAGVHHAISLDAPSSSPDGDGGALLDTLGGEDGAYDRLEHRLSVAGAVRHLTRRERRVLELRFGADLTQSEIAARLEVSQMQVSRILRGALGQLRSSAGPPA